MKWNGEGLPPVGSVCKGMRKGEWLTCEILKWKTNDSGMKFAACDFGDRGLWWTGHFCPIRSDKEKWIDQAVTVLSNEYTRATDIVKNRGYFKGSAVAIYDALISGELPIPKDANND